MLKTIFKITLIYGAILIFIDTVAVLLVFEETAFVNEVIDNPDLIPEFRHYKTERAPKYSIEDLTTFPIANTAVTAARKKIRNVINLDTNIQIKMDFINPESAERFVEKGWDEEKQMYYYLVYFNQEQKS